MALPAQLANLDGFIDLVVESLLREIRNPNPTQTNGATPTKGIRAALKDPSDAKHITPLRATP